MQRKLAIAAMAFGLGGCGLMAPDMKAYQGPDMSDSQLAVVEGEWDCPACLASVREGGYVYYDESRDGMRRSIKLRPGVYDVAYQTHTEAGVIPFARSDRVELKAGHTYMVRNDVCFAFCFSMPSYTNYFWIEDIATGQVVSGTKP